MYDTASLNYVSRIGVYPDGSPVVYNPKKERPRYTPEEAAEKRKEIAEELKAKLKAEGKDTSFVTISFAPELEDPRLMKMGEARGEKLDGKKLERTPDQDVMVKSSDAKMMACMPLMAKANPAEILAWIGVADAIGAIIQKYGPDVADMLIRIISATKNNSQPEQPKVPVELPEDVCFSEVA